MKSIAALCAATVFAFTLTACNQAPAPAPNTHDADVKALQDLETQWGQEWAAKDAAKVAARYADDAVVIVPGGPAMSGKDVILKALSGMMADPALALKFQSSKVDTAASGDLGYTQGSYTITMTDPVSKKVITDHGSYVTTYRKQADGSWKAVADISSSEIPPAFPVPAKKK